MEYKLTEFETVIMMKELCEKISLSVEIVRLQTEYERIKIENTILNKKLVELLERENSRLINEITFIEGKLK